MRIPIACVLLLAGCPKRGGGTGPVAQLGVGCPAASGVYIASYLTTEEAQGSAAKSGHTGWVLPLHDRVVASLDGVADYATIDAAAASAAGVPAPPANLWLLGQTPCKLTVGNYYAAAIDAPTPNVTYGVELTGCAAPQDPANASALVVVSEASPSECQILAPKPVAQRLGQVDKSNQWQKPTAETPIPAAFAGVIPDKPCPAGSCEKLWSIGQVELAGKPIAWAGAVNWLATTSNAPCDWKAETFSGFFIAGPDGAPVRVTEGQDHPLAMTAVLADKTGSKVVVAEGPGEYTSYDLAAGKATVGHHLVWLRPHPDSYAAIDHLGPDCGP